MKNGVNLDDVQKMNRALVMKLLMRSKVYSRAELSRMSGLRPATITNIINELRNVRLVKEEGIISGERGRNGIGISLDTYYYRVVGVRISKRYFSVGIFDIAGNTLENTRHKIMEDENPSNVMGRIVDEVENLIGRYPNKKTVAIGVAIPGPFFRNINEVCSEYGQWPGVHIKETLEKHFGINVFIEHDAKTGALFYYWSLNLTSDQMLIYFSAGHGIGAGIVDHGKLLIGAMGTAGEIGHMSIRQNGLICKCGNRGCLEMYCGTTALVRIIRQRIKEGNYSVLEAGCDLAEVIEAIQKGDHLAVAEYENACDALGVGVANIINILNPDIIVIGDEMASISLDVMNERIINVLRKRVHPFQYKHTNLKVVEEKDDISLRGAAIFAIEELMKQDVMLTWVDIG